LRKEKREFIGKAEHVKESRNKKIKPAKGIFFNIRPLLKWLDVISMEREKDRKE